MGYSSDGGGTVSHPLQTITPRPFQTTVPPDPEPHMNSRQRQALSPRAAWLLQSLQNYAEVGKIIVQISTVVEDLKQQFAKYKKGTLRKLVKELTQKGLATRDRHTIELTESGEQFSAVATASNANPSMTNVNVQSSSHSPTPQTCSASALAAPPNPAMLNETTGGAFSCIRRYRPAHDT